MGDFNWLQFSDLHFSTRESYSAATVRRALISCLKELKSEKTNFDYVFITGDIALKASYEGAESNVDGILSAVGVGKDKVFWAAGNHDIKRGSKIRGELIKSIRNMPDASAKFEELMADDEARSVLTYSGMADYIKEYNGLLRRSLDADEISGAHILHRLEHCNLIVLNTCLTSFDDSDINNLMITEPRLLKIFDGLGNKDNEKNKPLIVIGHHGKDFLHYSEGGKLARLFEDSGADIYLCGHSHYLGYARFDDAGRDIPQITCGCGVADGYGTVCFILGEYDSGSHTVRITPYSFREAGRFEADYGLHRRLTADNNTFHLSRFKETITAPAVPARPKLSFEDSDLFDRSQKFYDLLKREGGRFFFLDVEEKLIPIVKIYTHEAYRRGEGGVIGGGESSGRRGGEKGWESGKKIGGKSSEEIGRIFSGEIGEESSRIIGSEIGGESSYETHKLSDVLRNNSDHLHIIGEGGAGKTTSLLYVWESLLKDRTGYLPLYIPLNEYKPNPEFIREYIRLYYGFIDIYALNRNFLLLLDGFNEISGDAQPLVREIQDIMQRKAGFVRVVVTSRHGYFNEYHSMHQAEQFKICALQPLDEAAVNEYLENNHLSDNETPPEVLQTPMMLTLYAETSSLQKRIENKKIVNFKPNIKRGELIYNYMLCQVANCVTEARWEDIAPTWYALFAAAPYIAHHMESEGLYFIEKEEFRRLSVEYVKLHPARREIEAMPDGLYDLIRRHKPDIVDSPPVEDILLSRQYLLVEENERYTFIHQYFRDFFAALHIVNTIRESLAMDQFEMTSVIMNPWSIYVHDMLGDIYGDYINADGYMHHTPLYELLGYLRGNAIDGSTKAVSNVLATWRSARGERIIGEDLSKLDLSRIPLNGITFSKPGTSSNFNGSTISSTTFLPQGHSGSVTSAAYSADEGRLLSASGDGTIKEWDRETGACLRTFEGHSSAVTSAAYSADGERLLSASDDGTIKEWDRETGACLCTFNGHIDRVTNVAYSMDGGRLLSSSYDGTIKVWDRDTGTCLRTFNGHSSTVTSAAYSADGERLLSASWDKTIKEWDRETGTCLCTFEGHFDRVKSAVYSADGGRLLSASWDKTIKEWDRDTGACLRTFEGHSSWVNSAAYSADGERLLSASNDGTIKEWDRETGACLRTFGGYSREVTSAAYSADGRRLLSASWDKTIKEWDRETGACLRTFDGYSREVTSAVYSAYGRRLLSASYDGTIKEWDRETGACLRTFEGHSSRVNSAVYSADGGRLLSASNDRTIKEWDRDTGACLRTFEGHLEPVTNASYSADGERLLSVSWDTTIKEWNRETGACLRTFEEHSNWVNSVAYSADGGRLLSASWDNTIKEWDRETGACLRTFEGHSNGVANASYSADGGRLLSASYDRTIKEWDRETGACLRTFKGHSDTVTSAVYSADGGWLLSSSFDGTIKEWDRETGECLWTSPSYGGVKIAGCEFKGCRFSSPEIKRLVRQYGGIVVSPVLSSVRADNLRGEERRIDISLKDGLLHQNLIVTGPNGSGKTSLLLGIKQYVESIIKNGEAGEVSITFTDDNSGEAAQVLKDEYETGVYRFLFFPAERLYLNDGCAQFWDRLDKTRSAINQYMAEGRGAAAKTLQAHINRIEAVLRDLFTNEFIRLDYVEQTQKYRVLYKIDAHNEIESELNREALPYGFGSALDIFWHIIAPWDDVTAGFDDLRGLVIIDELESHLDVSMQKRIFPCLTKLFPSMQFIIATHSPYILNSANNATVFDMKKDRVLAKGDDEYGYQGWAPDEE